MNDALEIRAFKARLPDILRAAVRDGIQPLLDIPGNEELVRKAGGKDAAVDEAVRAVVEGMYAALLGPADRPAFMDPHVLSFCTAASRQVADHGLLSQWRGYGDDGGYAIVFDTARLDSLLKEEAEKWHYDVFGGDVIYSSDPDDKILEEFGQDIEQLKKCVADFFQTAGDPDTLENVYYPLVRCACQYKHWGFHEEREVRVIAIPPNDDIIEEQKRRGLPHDPKPRLSYLRAGTVVPCISPRRYSTCSRQASAVSAGDHWATSR